MGIQQRLYAQAHCNPSRQKSLDNQYTNMISSIMLPRETTLPPAPPSGQLLSSHRLAASCILLALFLRAPSFVFNHLQTLFAKYRGWGSTPTLPSQDSLPPSYAPRGASIPCGLSRLRILPVTTGVYPSSEVLLLTNRLIFSPSSGNLTGASPCPVRKGCCA